MIRVTIQLIPRGDESRARHMGTIEIANDGTGTEAFGNYKVRFSKMAKPTQTWRAGAIKGFDRKRRGPHDLLLQALVAVVGDRNQRVIDQLKADDRIVSEGPGFSAPRSSD